MADIFDEIEPEAKPDVFDQIAPSGGDVFDQVATPAPPPQAPQPQNPMQPAVTRLQQELTGGAEQIKGAFQNAKPVPDVEMLKGLAGGALGALRIAGSLPSAAGAMVGADAKKIATGLGASEKVADWTSWLADLGTQIAIPGVTGAKLLKGLKPAPKAIAEKAVKKTVGAVADDVGENLEAQLAQMLPKASPEDASEIQKILNQASDMKARKAAGTYKLPPDGTANVSNIPPKLIKNTEQVVEPLRGQVSAVSGGNALKKVAQAKPELEPVVSQLSDDLAKIHSDDLPSILNLPFTRMSKYMEKLSPTAGKLFKELEGALDEGRRIRGGLDVSFNELFSRYSPEVKESLLKQIDSKNFTAEGHKAFKETQALASKLADEAEALQVGRLNTSTGKRIPFQRSEYFAPRVGDPAKMAKGIPTTLRGNVVRQLIDEGNTPEQAEMVAKEMIRKFSRKSGSLQFTQSNLPFDESIFKTNAQEAFTESLGKEAERLAFLKRFGIRGEDGLLTNELGGMQQKYISKIREEAGDLVADKAEAYARRMMGIPEGGNEQFKDLSHIARALHSFKLLFVQTMNVGLQIPQGFAHAKIGPMAAVKQLARSFGESPEAADNARRLGVATAKTFEGALEKFDIAATPGTQAFMRLTGNASTEHFLEKFFSNVGFEDAKKVISELQANPTNKWAVKTAQWYGLDPQKVIREGATEENLWKGAHTFAKRLLLRGDVTSLPPAFTSETGKFMLQFKRAAQQQGQMLLDDFKLRPANFVKAVVAAGLFGELVEDVKASARGSLGALLGDKNAIAKELEKNPSLFTQPGVRSIVNRLTAAATLGMMSDLVDDLFFQKRDPLQSIASLAGGPSAGTAVNIGNFAQGLGKTIEGGITGNEKMTQGGLKQAVRAPTFEIPGGQLLRPLLERKPEERNPKRGLEIKDPRRGLKRK